MGVLRPQTLAYEDGPQRQPCARRMASAYPIGVLRERVQLHRLNEPRGPERGREWGHHVLDSPIRPIAGQEGCQVRYGWVILAMCATVLMSGPADATGGGGEIVLAPFVLLDWLLDEGLEQGLRVLLGFVVGLVVFVAFFTWLITWLVLRARRSRAVAKAQTQLKAELADIQRRLDKAEKELEEHRKAERSGTDE